MAGLWCRDFPMVTVPQGAEPKHVTLVYPYYSNPQFLALQLNWWHTHPADVRANLSAIIVDDGSPTGPAEDVLSGQPQPFPIRLFRIEQDVRWNWLAARNIGMYYAPEGWCVLTDIDHVVPASTSASLVYGQHNPKRVYAFTRIEHDGTDTTPHSASFLMTRAKFWEIGGYDERYSGFYGSDGRYRKRLAQHAQLRILTDRLIRHEYQGDSSTTGYLRKQPEDAGIKAIDDVVRRSPTPVTLSFPYHEVAL